MDNLQTNYTNSFIAHSPPTKSDINSHEQYNLDAHTSDNMKVQRTPMHAEGISNYLPNKKYFSDQEANTKIKTLNDEIFRNTHHGQNTYQYQLKPINEDRYDIKKAYSNDKENEKHGFNFRRYCTIFGIIALLAAAITYFRRK